MTNSIYEMMVKLRDKRLEQGEALPQSEADYHNAWLSAYVRAGTMTEAEARELYLPSPSLALHLLPL
jgi:hypothetical protein